MREKILVAAFTLSDKIDNCTAYRSREAALARSEGISVYIHPEAEEIQSPGAAAVTRDLMVKFVVLARGTIPDKAADSVVDALHSALFADWTLGGLVSRIIEDSAKWDFEVADQSAVAVEVRYRFRYITPANSLSSTL